MSPTPIVPSGKHPYHPDCVCKQCFETYQDRIRARNALNYGAKPDDPLSPARGIIIGLGLSLCILVALAGAALIWAKAAKAREGAVHPISAPESLSKARQACPIGKPLKCRAALVHAFEAVEWQKDAREHTQAMTVQAITRDAIAWAAQRYHVSAIDMIRVGVCESHLYPFATNGQYAGWAQLSARHRSDPIFQQVPWQDAYATASHVARYVKAHGWGEWQCRPEGGLRW